MVNKAVVGVIGVVLIVTLGVGALVGIQGGGGPAEETNGNGDTDTGPAEGTAGTATPTSTPAANATATPVSDDQISLTGREFDSEAIEENLTARIAQERSERNLDEIESGEDTTDLQLREMARNLSALMNEENVVAHEIGNQSTKDRFQQADLYEACKFKPAGKSYVAQPGGPNAMFEIVGSTVVETSFTEDRGVRYHANESAAANAIVDQWIADIADDEGFLSTDFGKMGVGVTTRDDGTVFSTVHLCGA